VASALREAYGRGVAWVSQDLIRRIILKEKGQPGAANIGLIDQVARYSLDHGYHVVLDGIFYADRYEPMLAALNRDHRNVSRRTRPYRGPRRAPGHGAATHRTAAGDVALLQAGAGGTASLLAAWTSDGTHWTVSPPLAAGTGRVTSSGTGSDGAAWVLLSGGRGDPGPHGADPVRSSS